MYAGLGSSWEIDMNTLKSPKPHSQAMWAYRGRLNYSTAQVDGQSIHFIHAQSRCPASIPFLINYGWPGSSFLEFSPVAEALIKRTRVAREEQVRTVAFDVPVPSLPDFPSSSPAPEGWTFNNTARINSTLMLEVLACPLLPVHRIAHSAAVAEKYIDWSDPDAGIHLRF
ncbi:uncharacterized protein F5Z01DRAFT_637876 [Emericellopsis atlantica]|uniref:Epoxide hydrolase N-terminal domain-containing protein n=1 Tax=Emericellopsis atlantica TaxID=2614577 RepID=A0A9P7ZJ93_9HYPO|nr:uncharacterized protein F5Z01DRAFT_637876 [Emericellopsis atlantica]KAG9253129.1 hypothetical protein F5Z01DRAFT_637876 [Emericellopsis atlantica]